MNRPLKLKFVSAGLLALGVVTLPAQDKKPPEKPPEKADAAKAGDDIPGLLKTLKEQLADPKKGKDAQARETIDKLVAAKLDAKTKKDVAKGLGAVVKVKREPGSCEIYTAACEGLAKLGADGAAELRTIIDTKPIKSEKEWQTFRSQAIEALGKTEDVASIKFLEDLFKDKFDHAIAAAGKAMGYFASAALEHRREIVGEMVKTLNSVYDSSKASVSPNDPQQQTFKERYDKMQNPWNESLAKLTGVTNITDPPAWQTWWNNNKKAKWPDPPKK